jgi:basic amino acid/polyamine antiporter, APA family
VVDEAPDQGLRRAIGLPGAVLMGIGSIVGTGLFVSLGIAAGIAGGAILLALPLAALLALLNGLSSAQLAAAHPVSGGTYAYGGRFLGPPWGFAAGTMFLVAKSASAATAALGLAGYLLSFVGVSEIEALRIGVAVAGVLTLAAIVAGGIRRSHRVNAAVVGVTLVVFASFLVAGFARGIEWGGGLGGPGQLVTTVDAFRRALSGWISGGLRDAGTGALLHATALLFVAYTGYGRIATLGEEVRDPSHTIPRAIWLTLGAVTVLYLGVTVVALVSLGADGFAWATAETAAPLQAVAAELAIPGLTAAVAVAAVTAMAGVLLNLLLGLSRVAFAMGRAGDLPAPLGQVRATTGSPRLAVWTVGGVVAAMALVGDVRVTWSFSAFTVLVYYGITNLAAIRLPAGARRYPLWVPVAGLLGCLLLAAHVPPATWVTGLGVLVLAFCARVVARRGFT